MALIEPFNFEQIFINILAGNALIFIFLFVAFLAGLAARMRMPNLIFGSLIALFGVIFDQFIPGLWILSVIIIAYIGLSSLANVFR